MIPRFSLKADAGEVTDRIKDSLVELRVVITSDSTSDYLEIVLDDRDNRLILPGPGGALTLRLGYSNEKRLAKMGVYIHTQTDFQLSPQRLTFRATAANFTKNSRIKAPKTRSWDQVTLGGLVGQIAEEHGYHGACAPELANIVIEHIDQTAESDLHLLRRYAHLHGAAFKTIGGVLLFAPQAKNKSGRSRRPLPSVTIRPGELMRGRVTRDERPAYASVIARYHDFDTGETVKVRAGEGEPAYELDKPRSDRKLAEADAKARLEQLQRSTAKLTVTVPGNPLIVAESRVVMEGFREEVNGQWNVTRATHLLNNRGYTTEVAAEKVLDSDNE